MKKVLLASTALALTAGMATADDNLNVGLSGYAEMGVKYTDDGAGNDDVRFHHDFDVKFTLSGETDNGLSFGATIDLDEVSNGIDADANPSSVFVSGDFGTLTMGDTDGAFDWAMSEIAWGTAIADDHSEHAGWNGNSGLDGGLDNQVARYEYAFTDFAVAISAEIGDDNDPDEDDDTFFDADEIFGIGAKYATDFGGASVGFGIGYQQGGWDGSVGGIDLEGDADIWGISLSADMDNGFSTRLNYSKANADGEVEIDGDDVDWDYDLEHYGIGIAYQMDALLVEANYGHFDRDVDADGDDFDSDNAEGYGLAVNYDLGGGAVFMVGYGHGTGFGTDDSAQSFSAGLGLSF